jgi:hypothetical protein
MPAGACLVNVMMPLNFSSNRYVYECDASSAWTYCNSISRNHFLFFFLLFFSFSALLFLLQKKTHSYVCTSITSYVRYLFTLCVGPVKSKSHSFDCT